ncbi:MAG TPA: aminoacyl--tRNA ligase-related protein [Patescibacteria group bacterium]|nr:aminoacyl--tRNA ligase-related protein [Patescibacteria group bacterium]
MRFTQLFTKTSKTKPSGEESVNAILLEQAGFVYKNSAGIYTHLPLGWRVMQNIAQIIREEMNAIDGQELFMPALHDKHYLQATGRWDVDVVFKVSSGIGKEPDFNISWTHEEIFTEIASRFIKSYRDLPFAGYQIQTKFRNEPRAKSGLLRGREFMMKDLYSFHTSEEELFAYYDKAKEAYLRVFDRCGLKAYYTLAAGGDFTASNTHEFQVVAPVGEDTIMLCRGCEYAENIEVSKLTAGDLCVKCGAAVVSEKSIEVGNIFPLGTKYSKAFDLSFTDTEGNKQLVVMGSYGIGLGRVMATVVEVSSDERGIIWPESIAPFKIHVISLPGGEAEAQKFYDQKKAEGITVLFDDREGVSAGEKFADADLIGVPKQYIFSKRSLEKGGVEVKSRKSGDSSIVEL